MKVTVTEIRKAEFREPGIMPAMCRICFEYEVRVDDIETRRFFSEESVEAYLKYIKERKNDYTKVIKEIEI